MSTTEIEPTEVKPKRGELTPAHRLACQMIALGGTDVEVAAKCNVATTTVAGWRKQERFQEEINRCVGTVQRTMIRKAQSLLPRALEELEELLNAPKTGPMSLTPTQRLATIKLVLDRLPTDARLAAEPTPDAPELAARALTPVEQLDAQETLLEIYREMAKIEESRKRLPTTSFDPFEDEDDEGAEPDHRVIEGELAEDDEPVTEPEPIRPSGPRTTRALSPAENEREIRRMASGLGGGAPLGGSRIRGY